MLFGEQRRAARVAWAPSRARRVLRHRVVRIVLAVTAAVLVAVFVQDRSVTATTAVERWGSTTSVVVVERFVAAGDELAEAVALGTRPTAMVPSGAMTAVPIDGRAGVDLYPGELLLLDRVRNADERGMPRGTLAVTVVIDGAAPLVTPGDLVDLWVTDAANLSSRRVVDSVVVLARHDEELTIAVPEQLVGDVAVAALRPLTVALLE